MADNPHALKEAVGAVFTRAATGYGDITYFPQFGQRLVALARLPYGARVLDVASGRGAVLFPAAEQVGPQGWVMGIDLSEGMVQETAAVLRQRGVANAELHQMDAEDLHLAPATFDHVLCGFGLSFFPDLSRALSEFHRVLKPRGRIGVTVWGREDEHWVWYDRLRTSYGAVAKLNSQMLDRPKALYEVLKRAGFTEIDVFTEEKDWVCADAEEWWSAMWSISGRAGLERLDGTALDSFKAEAFRQIHARDWPEGIRCRLQAHFALATRP
jgi:ubiquinone/menaquinone biosynthesis C-methylase UbiE